MRRNRGFVLLTMCATLFLLMAMIGLAFDFGRVYIARNEAQVFTDAAAMTAARKLDGTGQGLERARAAVKNLPARWNLGTSSFDRVIVEFSTDGERWEVSPDNTAGLRFARVTAPSNEVEITFLRAAGAPGKMNVAARSTASANPVRLVE